jgi:methylmalonyl-CoA mutase N-terminal domain/subunit
MLEGVLGAIEEGWFQGQIADAAHDFERRLNDGRRVLVGVNRFTEGDEGEPDILYIDEHVEEAQRKRLDSVKRDRDGAAVAGALDRLRSEAADPDTNLMPAVLEAVSTYATVGEVEDDFGTWREPPGT